jgi:hypothetical protein
MPSGKIIYTFSATLCFVIRVAYKTRQLQNVEPSHFNIDITGLM